MLTAMHFITFAQACYRRLLYLSRTENNPQCSVQGFTAQLQSVDKLHSYDVSIKQNIGCLEVPIKNEIGAF